MNPIVQEEYDKVKNNVFYLDWNIISYLLYTSQLSGDLKDKILCLSHLIMNNFNLEYSVFPYSNAHFLDIKQGDETRYKEKIEFLKNLSKCWEIYEDPNNKEQLFIRKENDIENEFDEYVKELDERNKWSDQNAPFMKRIIEPYLDDAKKIIKDNGNGKYKEEIENLLNSLIPGTDQNPQIEVLKFSKLIKNEKFIQNGKKFKFPIATKEIEDFNSETIQREINQYFQSSDFPHETAEDFLKTLLNVPYFSLFQQKVQKLSALSDFIGLSSEKTKKNSSFQSIVNDQFHLLYGLRSHYFITEDKNLLIKGHFIKKWLKLNVKIFNIDDFIKFILGQFHVNSNSSTNQDEIEYIFKDKNGNEIRKYNLLPNKDKK